MTNPFQKPDIKDLSLDQLISWLDSHRIQPYRAKQIFKWIYQGKSGHFDSMTDLGLDLRRFLSENFTLHRPLIKEIEISMDGTKKYLFSLNDGKNVESVLIPEKDHSTLCISSQIGCAQGCAFCLTGITGFIRNLTMGEIIAQILGVESDSPQTKRLTNIVFMGMGEPLANYHHVINAINMITNDEYGLGYSTHKITISTAGIVPKLLQLNQDTDANLAISLNAVDNQTRSRLMPVNSIYPIEQLLEACRSYPLKPRRKITFEYILIKGINDSIEDAKRLAELLKPIKAKINLIPFNEHPKSNFKRPDEPAINQFREELRKKHFTVITRYSKGQDISAACGQLSVKV